MNKTQAQILSYLLHPAIFPVVGALYLFNRLPTKGLNEIFYLSLVVIVVGTYVIPIAASLLLHKLGYIKSLEMKLAKDRRLPYLIGCVCHVGVAYLLSQMPLPKYISLYLLGSASVILLHLFLLSFFKPSAHLASIGGFTGLVMGLALQWHLSILPTLAFCIVLAGIMASARLKLEAHTYFELAFGFFSSWLVLFAIIQLG